jgi:mono/diheme cytochrome c family protein
MRDGSIAGHSANLQIPDLEDSALILKGAGQYAAMCVDCHLAPGIEKSEIRPGLYPEPPNLAHVRIAPNVAFWAIKHGIKMSAMPAWGASHDDPTIWSMVASRQKLPGMTRAQYKEIIAKAPRDEDMDMDEGEEHGHDHGDADGTRLGAPEWRGRIRRNTCRRSRHGTAANNAHPDGPKFASIGQFENV